MIKQKGVKTVAASGKTVDASEKRNEIRKKNALELTSPLFRIFLMLNSSLMLVNVMQLTISFHLQNFCQNTHRKDAQKCREIIQKKNRNNEKFIYLFSK